jgi:hypothetical protein
MELRSSQIGTSIDGGLGPQNPVTRKKKPVLFITMGLQAASARILVFPQKKFRGYQKG